MRTAPTTPSQTCCRGRQPATAPLACGCTLTTKQPKGTCWRCRSAQTAAAQCLPLWRQGTCKARVEGTPHIHLHQATSFEPACFLQLLCALASRDRRWQFDKGFAASACRAATALPLPPLPARPGLIPSKPFHPIPQRCQWRMGAHHTDQWPAADVPPPGAHPLLRGPQVGTLVWPLHPNSAVALHPQAIDHTCECLSPTPSARRCLAIARPISLLPPTSFPAALRRLAPRAAFICSGVIYGVLGRCLEAVCGCKLIACNNGGAEPPHPEPFDAALLGTGGIKLSGTPTYRMPRHPMYKDMFQNPMYKPIW